LDSANAHDPGVTTTSQDIIPDEQEALGTALRVDQAGEIMPQIIFTRDKSYLNFPMLQKCEDQEKRHLIVMNRLQIQYLVRSTILFDVAKAAGYSLGVVTALLGKEAGTEAIETV
ncbi:ubiquinone biosynthesis protein COQ7-domain-containing protein, partial [Melanogaster broomeanus]